MAVTVKGQTCKVVLDYGSGKGSYTIGNLNPAATSQQLYDLGASINKLQAKPKLDLYMVREYTLEDLA